MSKQASHSWKHRRHLVNGTAGLYPLCMAVGIIKPRMPLPFLKMTQTRSKVNCKNCLAAMTMKEMTK